MGVSNNDHPRPLGPKTTIGIDFGSSKCCVGMVCNGNVVILENECGNKTTPSYVAFTEMERLVGESARDEVTHNPTNTVFGVKQLLGGRGETRDTIEGLTKHLPYDVAQEKDGVKIKVTYKGKEKKLSPEQIAAMLLSKMRKLAEKHLGRPVREAVIAVPAHFTNAQRRALKDAGTIAGLTVLGLISETTAAAVTYQHWKTFAKKQNVLVVDIGGGAFNAALVEVQNASVEVKAIGGTTELSGGELDRLLMEHMADRFTRLNKVDVTGNKRERERLRAAGQKTKHVLTLVHETVILVEYLVGEVHFSDPLTRAEFNKTILPGVQETIEKVLNSVLSDAKLTLADVDEIVLNGGTTRVPVVQETLVKLFAGKPLNKTINPDEAVAYGAALQAAILARDNSIAEVRVVDIFSNPVVYPNYIKRFKTQSRWLVIPKCGEEYSLYYDWYPNKYDKSRKKLHHFIDSCGVYIPKCAPGVIEKMKTSNLNGKLIQMYLADEEVCSMTSEVEQFDRDDEEYSQLMCAVDNLEGLCMSVERELTCGGDSQETISETSSDRLRALEYCEETLDLLELDELATKKHYENEIKKLQDLFTKAKIEKSKDFINDVNEENRVRVRKETDKEIQSELSNGVVLEKLVDNSALLDTDESRTHGRNESVSEQKVSPCDGYRNANGNSTEPSEATSVPEVVESPSRCGHEFNRGVPKTAAEKKSTRVGVSHPGNIAGRSNEVAGVTCKDSTTLLPNGLQPSMIHYRDPNGRDGYTGKSEFRETVPTVIGVYPDLHDGVACNGQRDCSDNSDIKCISQSFQNISLNSQVTDSTDGRVLQNANLHSSQLNSNSKLSEKSLYSEALKVSHQLRSVPQTPAGGTAARCGPDGQINAYEDEPMDVGPAEHGVHVGHEVALNNVGWDMNALQNNQNPQESACCPPPTRNIIQECQLPGPIGFVVNKQLTNAPGPNHLGVAHHIAGMSDQQQGRKIDQEGLRFISQFMTSAQIHHPPPAPAWPSHLPPQHTTQSNPSDQEGNNYGHGPCPVLPNQAPHCIGLPTPTVEQIRQAENVDARKMVCQEGLRFISQFMTSAQIHHPPPAPAWPSHLPPQHTTQSNPSDQEGNNYGPCRYLPNQAPHCIGLPTPTVEQIRQAENVDARNMVCH